MKFNTEQLLTELTEIVNTHLNYATVLEEQPEEILNWRAHEKSWSILECLEHLNLYGAFYIPEISQRMERATSVKTQVFKSGYLGNKFAMDMLPKEGMKTMKTFKSKNPIHSKLDKGVVLKTFIQQQQSFLTLLKTASEKNLTTIKVATTIPFLKLRLGDTLRFVIHHNERHITQAKNIKGN
jgi:hypothetical protein